MPILFFFSPIVETQDDPVASAVFSMRQKEMAGLDLVPGLLKDNFYRSIRRTPLLIVLFYEPCKLSKIFEIFLFCYDFGTGSIISQDKDGKKTHIQIFYHFNLIFWMVCTCKNVCTVITSLLASSNYYFGVRGIYSFHRLQGTVLYHRKFFCCFFLIASTKALYLEMAMVCLTSRSSFGDM